MPYSPISDLPSKVAALSNDALIQQMATDPHTWQERDWHGAIVAEALYRGLLR